jgi:phospholipid-translocating P-type ATPase (flippase)
MLLSIGNYIYYYFFSFFLILSFFISPTYENHIAENGDEKNKINQFFRILAICHDVIPERIDGEIKLSASNPDDEAFVCASEYFGCQFCDRVENSIVLLHKDAKQEERVELLETIEFTSKRKRMSVIVRNSSGQIELLTKGADSAIIDDGRLHSGQDDLLTKSKSHMDQYGNEGLRCLVVGYSILSEEVYETWSNKYKLASTDMEQINKKKKGLSNLIEDLEDEIERNLTLIGVTAIEDRLQDGVPECISKLVLAGIKIWMLTGDKDETATNIAVACNLVQPEEYMRLVKITKSRTPTKESIIEIFNTELKNYFDKSSKDPVVNGKKNIGLIIDGQSLATIMLDTQVLRPLLLEFSQVCNAVVGCRVSPDQKRSMVNLIKVGAPGVRTLSIGDGANDVAMIQEAHVGVGIRGEEGLQAVNSSDFAIAQFRFLAPLLLKHGRYNYVRMTSLVCYMFYKNVMMSIAQFWFNFNCAFSGQKYYTEGAIQLFNLAFTSFPILLLGVYDMDISPKFSIKFAQIYRKYYNFT